MIRWRKREGMLIGICIISIGFYLMMINTREVVKTHDYTTKLDAAYRMQELLEVIKDVRLTKGISIDRSIDINNTGIIGDEISDITTTLGSLESKRTSVNPNFAAVIVGYLDYVGIEKGDSIAVNLSSSFPAMNLAVHSAIESMELEPIIMNSIGSSTHGANNIGFTYMEMESTLFDRELISNKSEYVSLGGDRDIGLNFFNDGVKLVRDRASVLGYELLYDEDFDRNINLRMKLYAKDAEPLVFINVGGNAVGLGNDAFSYEIPHGILRNHRPKQSSSSGLISRYLNKGIPVIHILNIKAIAKENGLPLDPVSMPQVGSGGIYYETKYNKTLGLLFLAILIIALLIYQREDRKLD